MDEPGFVCVEANVVDAQGARVKKKHRWEPRVFFMGGAAVAPEALRPGTEPADYDDFWNAQMAALEAVPIETEWDGKALLLDGTSQGGWQALMAASLVPHATKITTGVTWGCDWTGQNEYGRLPSGYRPK